MKRYFVASLLLAIASPALAALPSNTEVEAILQKQLIGPKKAKGVAVALVDADGIRVVTAGEARTGVPLTAEHLFEIGSITKTFAALLLALAEENGEAKLADPVEKFLPAGLTLRDSTGEPLRMVDLATHRSGLPRLASNMLPKNPKNPYADYSEQDLLDFIRTWKPARARNAQYEYSNVGFGLLGYALVRAAQAKDFEALLAARILQPLGMRNSTSDAKRFLDRLVQPHDANGLATQAWDFQLPHAAAGAIRATAEDMGRYLQAVAGLRDTPLSAAINVATTIREGGPGRINPIGLAWLQVPFHERELRNHDGGTFGSSSSIMLDRKTREGVFIVANTATPLNELALHLLDRRLDITPRVFPQQVSVAEAKLAAYAGTYKVNDQMSITVRVSGGKVTAQATRQGEFEIFAESETRFFAKVAPIVMTFGDIADGKAGSFVIEQGGSKITARRVPAP